MVSVADRRIVVDRNPNVVTVEKLKVKVVRRTQGQLTHTAACTLLEMKTFDGERKEREDWVQHLYNQWLTGRFRWELVTIVTCRYKGEMYRLNGQHTCWMRLNLPEKENCSVEFYEYEVDSEDQLRALYAVIDRGKSRTHGHIIKASLTSTEYLGEVWPSLVNILAAGMKLWLYEKSNDQRQNGPDEMVALIQGQHNALFKLVGGFVQERIDSAQHIKRASTIAAIFATFDKAKTIAPEFWQPVCDGLNLGRKTDPRYQLRDTLMRSSVRGSVSDKRVLGQEDMYRICVAAWNKWRKGEECATSLRAPSRRYKAV